MTLSKNEHIYLVRKTSQNQIKIGERALLFGDDDLIYFRKKNPKESDDQINLCMN